MASDAVTASPPEVRTLPRDEFAERAAGILARHITEATGTRASCRLALSGGGTPAPVYQALARRNDIDWGSVDVFWSDERAVPLDDPSSNYRLARECLLDQIRPRRVEPMPVALPPDAGAARYERTLGAEPLDVVLLGLGSDGHTASLFPGASVLDEREARVAASRAPEPPHDRLTLTLRALNEARQIVFLVTGEGKARRLAEILGPRPPRVEPLPAARVAPGSGRVLWLVDEAAARELNRKELS